MYTETVDARIQFRITAITLPHRQQRTLEKVTKVQLRLTTAAAQLHYEKWRCHHAIMAQFLGATNDWCAAIAFAPAFTGRESAMTGRNIIQLNFGPVFAIIKKANEARTLMSAKPSATLPHGFTTKDATAITMNTGSILLRIIPKFYRECRCHHATSLNYNLENYNDRLPLEYYERGKSHYTMHPETAELLERLLHMLAEEGEDKTFAYIRNELDLKHSRWH